MTDNKQNKFKEWLDEFFEVAWVLPGGLLMFAGFSGGLVLLAYQLYQWLRTGGWIEYPMAIFLLMLDVDLTPIYFPQDWKGIAAIVRFFIDSHAGLCLFNLGVVLLLVGMFLQKCYDE